MIQRLPAHFVLPVDSVVAGTADAAFRAAVSPPAGVAASVVLASAVGAAAHTAAASLAGAAAHTATASLAGAAAPAAAAAAAVSAQPGVRDSGCRLGVSVHELYPPRRTYPALGSAVAGDCAFSFYRQSALWLAPQHHDPSGGVSENY